MERISKKIITRNILISIFAQIISLGTSFILNLIVPKYISTIEYSMWQVYILYASFVGICHWGLMDGFLLKYSQYDYEKLDKNIAHSHFVSLIIILFINALILLALGYITKVISESLALLLMLAVIIKNLSTFGIYIFQATNRIGKYAQLIIFQRSIYAIIIVILLIIKIDNYIYFCIADLIADVIGCLFSLFYNNRIYIGNFNLSSSHKQIVKDTILAGSCLMIANFSSNLIVGACKMIIEWTESKLIFGQIAFAFSITNLALTFVIAVSVVLFPSLKRINQTKLGGIYNSIRIIISEGMYLILILYYPCTYILQKWLPNYKDSLYYLIFLFPIILFSTKIALLTNNFFKVCRMEKKLLAINVISVVIEIVGLVILYPLKQICLLLIWTVMVTYIRSVISEITISKKISVDYISFNLQDGIIAAIFILTTLLYSTTTAIIVMLLIVCVFSLINRKKINNSIKYIAQSK